MARQRKTRDVVRIIGTSSYGTEEIDQFDTWKEARAMVAQYRLAYGPGWTFKLKAGRERIAPQPEV